MHQFGWQMAVPAQQAPGAVLYVTCACVQLDTFGTSVCAALQPLCTQGADLTSGLCSHACCYCLAGDLLADERDKVSSLIAELGEVS
jgi:hypothetical protein